MSNRIERILEPIISLFFPPRCQMCGNKAEAADLNLNICAGCWRGVRAIGDVVCFRCGLPIEAEAAADLAPTYYCAGCRTARLPYAFMRSLYRYEPPLREMIHAFKFEGMINIGEELGKRMATWVATLSDFETAEVIVPVPLHPMRRIERGFNQSRILARRVSEKTGIPLLRRGIVRTRNTPPQSKLAHEERLRSLKGAFDVPRQAMVSKKTVLLIDDVSTTEATVRECARTLRRSGAARVIVLTLARTV